MRRSLLLLGLASALLFAADPPPAWGKGRARGAKVAKRRTIRREPPVPTFTREGLPNIRARAAVIVDLDEGVELYAKNPDELRPVASVGKLFLALAVREKDLPLEGKTTITAEDVRWARGGARSRLPVGWTFTNHDLLRAMLMASDNRACTALGRAAGLTPEELIEAMNATARRLGLRRTRLTDASGLNGNVSTAREIAVALRAALADPVLAAIMRTPQATVRSVDGPRPIVVDYISTDVALRTENRFPVLGGKTGYTDEARYCLAIAARPNGRRIGMVFLGAEGKLTRFADFRRGIAWLLERRAPDAPRVEVTPAVAVGRAIVRPPEPVTPRLVR